MSDMICKGAWELGTACGRCSRCREGLEMATRELLDELLIHKFNCGDLIYKPSHFGPHRLPEPKPDGGLAFPSVAGSYGQNGMSLRDWFAGQVMVGLLTDGYLESLPANRAYAAYAHADAMLAERAK